MSQGLAVLGHILARGVERGEIRSDALVRFPHLVIAPALVAILWKSIFEPFEPLDADAMFEAHIAIIASPGEDKP